MQFSVQTASTLGLVCATCQARIAHGDLVYAADVSPTHYRHLACASTRDALVMRDAVQGVGAMADDEEDDSVARYIARPNALLLLRGMDTLFPREVQRVLLIFDCVCAGMPIPASTQWSPPVASEHDDADEADGAEALDDVAVMGEMLQRDALMQTLVRFEHAPLSAPPSKKKGKKRKSEAVAAATLTQVRTTRVTAASLPGTGK